MKNDISGLPVLNWLSLHDDTKTALSGKLAGLYGWLRTDEVFDSLAVNRQPALLLLLRRFQELTPGDAVRSNRVVSSFRRDSYV